MKYKIKKNGFTLSELIAVLVVLTLLISIGTAVFMRVRTSVLNKDYNNLVDYLTLKAEEYAEETGITTISVQDLIDAGLIKPDDNEFVYDPRDKTMMNCYIIKSVFENGHYIATLDENYIDEDGSCKKYESSTDYKICRVNGDVCAPIDNGKWLTGDVTLGIQAGNNNKVLTEDDNISFYWDANIGVGAERTGNTLTIDSSGTKKAVYTCIVKIKSIDEETEKETVKSYEISQAIWIDNDAPIINKIEFTDEVTEDKDVKIYATDNNGSGIKGYAIVNVSQDTGQGCPDSADYNDSYTINLKQKGTYKACVIDNVGNVGVTRENFEVNSIVEKATIKVKSYDGILQEPAIITINNYFEITCPDNKSCDSGTYYYNNKEVSGSLSLNAGVHKITCKVVTDNTFITEAVATIRVYPKIANNGTPVDEVAGSNKEISNYFTITCSSGNCSTSCYYNNETNILNVNELGLGSYKITCKAYVKSDDTLNATADVDVNVDFNISKKNDSESISVGDSKIVQKDFFDIKCEGSNCATTCNYEDTSGLGVGVHTLKCTTKWNGDVQEGSDKVTEKSAEVNLTVYPKISAKNSNVTINVGDNYSVINYFNITCPTSGCNTTCNYSTTGSLAIGSYTLTCTTGIGNVKKSASVNLKVKARIPSTPSVSATLGSTSGSYYDGGWTNNSVYFSLSPSVSTDSITYYNVYWGSTKKKTINTSNNYATYSYTSNAETTVYFEACNENGCSDKTSGYSMNIDKTPPTCSLSVSSRYVTLNYNSDAVDYGLTVGSSTSYNGLGAYKIAAARFYGHVRDRAGNTGTCSVRITVKESDEYTYKCDPYKCNPYQCDPYECGSTSQTCTFRCYRKATSTEIANSTCYSVGAGKTGAYESTYKTCYVNASGTSKDCSSVYSGKFPYLDNSYNNTCTSTGTSKTCYNTCYETCYETCTDYDEYCPSGYYEVSSSSVYCYR